MKDKLSLFSFKPELVKLSNGMTVHLRRLSGMERVEWIERLSGKLEDAKDKDNLKVALEDSAFLLCLTLCDIEGRRIFSNSDIEQVKQIEAQTFDYLVKESLKLNGLGSEGKEAVKKK